MEKVSLLLTELRSDRVYPVFPVRARSELGIRESRSCEGQTLLKRVILRLFEVECAAQGEIASPDCSAFQ
jgi:hypothetical protein